MTLFELLVVVGIVSLLAVISVSVYVGALEKSRRTHTIAEIRVIERELTGFQTEGALPASLDQIGWGNRLDAWGNPYRYLRLETNEHENVIPGQARKDRFLVPLNTDYDLYSMGPDGDSKSPLTAKVSRDDILRAADGAFVGLASEF